MCLTEYNEEVFIKGIREEGENKLGKLISLLLSDGRIDDIQKATSDKEARKQFYREYGIID